MDWTGCEYVECVEDRTGGVPTLRGTRVTADSVYECFEDGRSVLEIAWYYSLDPLLIQGALKFAFAQEQSSLSPVTLSNREVPAVDWTGCEFVEVIEGKVSGVPLLRNTRMPADAVWECAFAGYSVPEIAYDFTLIQSEIEGALSWAWAQTALQQAS